MLSESSQKEVVRRNALHIQSDSSPPGGIKRRTIPEREPSEGVKKNLRPSQNAPKSVLQIDTTISTFRADCPLEEWNKEGEGDKDGLKKSHQIDEVRNSSNCTNHCLAFSGAFANRAIRCLEKVRKREAKRRTATQTSFGGKILRKSSDRERRIGNARQAWNYDPFLRRVNENALYLQYYTWTVLGTTVIHCWTGLNMDWLFSLFLRKYLDTRGDPGVPEWQDSDKLA